MTFHFQPFHFDIASPLKLKQGLLFERRGFYLSSDAQLAESSPFPGLSSDSFESIQRLLLNSEGCLDALELDSGTFPSLDFALGMLHYPLTAISGQLKLNALFLNQGDPLIQIAEAYDSGYRTFKLKLGYPGREVEDQHLISTLTRTYPDIHLRLDLNRSWTKDQTLSFLDGVPKNAIEYLEEPCLQTHSYLSSEFDVTLALDESLQDMSLEHMKDMSFSDKILVVKPMVLGWNKTQYLLQTFPKQVVISSAFESPLAWLYLARLALKYNPEKAHGLDTWRVWGKDLPVVGGKLEMSDLINHRIFDIKF